MLTGERLRGVEAMLKEEVLGVEVEAVVIKPVQVEEVWEGKERKAAGEEWGREELVIVKMVKRWRVRQR